MIEYFSRQYTPISKFKFDHSSVTPLLVWTPSASKRIAMTGLTMNTNLPCTYLIRFGSRGGSPDTFTGSVVVFQGLLGSSARMGSQFQSPIVCPDLDLPLYVETSVSGDIRAHIQGFEIP